MQDLFFVALAIVFFAATLGLVSYLQRLREEG